jgi:5-amino-6-(5-phosphoribosylamino)uracil reductase/diaminohydroxyphosphoribosylaminopyrimidine deaminase/5-amino-6-(5-phosphoribosylamino)uracil reductase
MACELQDDGLWPALLSARTELASAIGDLLFVQHGTTWRCMPAMAANLRGARQVLAAPDPRVAGREAPQAPPDCALSVYDPNGGSTPRFDHPTGRPVDPNVLSMAQIYLPVVLGTAAARGAGRVFVAGHVTQTLDGRIACENGQSKWIGNEADLRHAHRMRALLDAVMVGAGTALCDDPQLTVRHVEGPDPRRIVLSGRGRVLRHGAGLRVFTPPGCDVVVDDTIHDPLHDPMARLIKVRAKTGSIEPCAMLEVLRDRGIHSVYLEGGSTTVSSFLQSRCIDLLQIHIAAMVMGSGLPSFVLPAVDHVQDSIKFTMAHAILDGHVLLSCWPTRSVPARTALV